MARRPSENKSGGQRFLFVLRRNAPLPSNCLDLCFFDKLVVRLLRLMHISQKSFLPRFLYDLPVGHDRLLDASLYQTGSFQDNANYDKFHHPALCALPLISLIRENGEGSALSAEGHVVWLNDAEAAAPAQPPLPAASTSPLPFPLPFSKNKPENDTTDAAVHRQWERSLYGGHVDQGSEEETQEHPRQTNKTNPKYQALFVNRVSEWHVCGVRDVHTPSSLGTRQGRTGKGGPGWHHEEVI